MGSNVTPRRPVSAAVPPADDSPEFFEGTLADGLDDPADPSVSPADTPEATCPGCGRPVSECRAEDVDDPLFPEPVSPADTPEALADIVSEAFNPELFYRDDADAIRDAAGDALDALLAEWERDRRQIARLTASIEDYLLWEPGRAGHAEAHRRLRAAVLADEEDAANG